MIYLSYPMTQALNSGFKLVANGLAEKLREQGLSVFVPHEHFGVENEDVACTEIVKTESEAVRSSDMVITLLSPRPSYGCGAEYQIACDAGIPIYAFADREFKVSRFVLGLVAKSGGLVIRCPGITTEKQYVAQIMKELPHLKPRVRTECHKQAKGKLMLELVHPEAICGIAEILQDSYEKGKYGKWNWLKGGPWSTFYGALQRHLYSWYEGHDQDAESKRPHLAHALCNLMFLYVWGQFNLGTDDRALSQTTTKE